MKREKLILALQGKWQLNAVPSEDFGEHYRNGIWIRDDICKPSTDYYNYADATLEDNKLNRFLTRAGWFAEPYDSETILLYRI